VWKVILEVTKLVSDDPDQRGPRVEQVSGRLLCYVAPNNAGDLSVVRQAAALTGRHGASGLVVRGGHTHDVLRSLGRAATRSSARQGARQQVVVDPGKWTKEVATADAPLGLTADEDVLIPLTLCEWAQSWLDAGADGVLTPSKFVPSDDWPALKAVLAAGTQVSDPRVATLVATDAAMLDQARLATFLDTVDEQRGGRPLAFVFAARSAPLARTARMAGLRALLGAFPDSLVVGGEVAVATDVLVHGGAAAIGLRSSQRQPRRPSDKGGGPQAEGWMPGMFVRELWETRSPAFYADWYANRPAPFCARCGRGPESFTTDKADKDAILIHNVHAWLDVLTDLRREGTNARAWLVNERWRAYDAHRHVGPPGTGAPIDDLLAAVCDLDGPQQQRHTTPAP
jgi:hypothetical protein